MQVNIPDDMEDYIKRIKISDWLIFQFYDIEFYPKNNIVDKDKEKLEGKES